MNTQAEIEAAVCAGMIRFEQHYMGRGPERVSAHLVGDLIAVRLTRVMTAAEPTPRQNASGRKGRDLVKQVRAHLTETARPLMEEMIEKATGVQVVSLHHDISTTTGEEVVVFTMATAPSFREVKR